MFHFKFFSLWQFFISLWSPSCLTITHFLPQKFRSRFKQTFLCKLIEKVIAYQFSYKSCNLNFNTKSWSAIISVKSTSARDKKRKRKKNGKKENYKNNILSYSQQVCHILRWRKENMSKKKMISYSAFNTCALVSCKENAKV